MKDLDRAGVCGDDQEGVHNGHGGEFSTTIDINVGECHSRGHFLLPPLREDNINGVANNPDLFGVSNGTTASNGILDTAETPLVVLPSTLPASSTNDSHFVHQINVPNASSDPNLHKFSSQKLIESFTERVSVSALPAEPRHSCAAFCNHETEERCREAVHLAPRMAPITFNASIVCYKDCTKKRFKTTVFCEPRLRPVKFGETQFVWPKHLESRYVSYVDYKTDTTRRWYTSAVQINQGTSCSSFVRSFQFQEVECDDEEGEDRTSNGSSGFSDDEGVLNVDCSSVHNGGHADHGSDGYRTRIVIEK